MRMRISSSLRRQIAACLLGHLCSTDLTQARPAPQFELLETGMALAAAQVKGMIDGGGAARSQPNFDVLGAKLNTDTALGFGEAIRSGMGQQGRRRRRGRRRRQVDGDEAASYESSAQDSNADEYDTDMENSRSDDDDSDMDA